MMLICPHSGLGNQIGNYVFAKFLMTKGFDVKFLVTNSENLDRTFVLDKFNTNIELASDEDIREFVAQKPCFLYYERLLSNVIFKNKAYFNSLYKVLARIRAEYNLYPKKNFSFLSKIISYEDVLKYGLNQGAVCDCYSPIPEFEKESFKNEIRKQFALKTPLNKENLLMLEKIKNAKNPVGVHIRRGDYLDLKIPVVKSEFILKKMNYMVENLDGTHFFIFSDGMEWAKKHLQEFKNLNFVDINDENHGYFDFALMNECKHRIYSASSFSKWLEYLNFHINSLEFMPENFDLVVEN